MDVCKVFLLAHLTRDPELRYTPQGVPCCSFTLAVNRTHTSKPTGQKVEEVSFIECLAWGKTGELCAEHLKKGSRTHVEGRIAQERWEAADGRKMSKLKVMCERVTFLGSRPSPAGNLETSTPEGTSADSNASPRPEEEVPFK
jgi:single-strand DNA-binding protein